MARLIFCFFAEDTGIFVGDDLFTATLRQMTEADGSNTSTVLAELFRAMNLDPRRGQRAGVRPWADVFPFVNGGLFQDDIGCPRFTRTSRAYLLRAGELDWRTINPDIFGSMIQAVADDEERGALGMHYTSVPNIQKVLDPLFLDDLREGLEAAGTNGRKLLNLRRRLSRIRVFDPACGSGNFLVIAYIRMREIEAEIMARRGETLERSAIALTQFHGIEIKSFAAEVARLSLLIAEFQCDERFIGQTEARALVLPLHATGRIVTGNALRLDWEKVCPPVTASVEEQDLGGSTGRLNLEGSGETSETFICGNPPYLGSTWQTKEQKLELDAVFGGRAKNWKSLDYVSGWFIKAGDYGKKTPCHFSFVSTNSICQGQQVPVLWPVLFQQGYAIRFARTSFKWANLASYNAGVTVAVVCLAPSTSSPRVLYTEHVSGRPSSQVVANINAYLSPGSDVIVEKISQPLSALPKMIFGNKVVDGGNLRMSQEELDALRLSPENRGKLVRRIYGSSDFIRGELVYYLWIEGENLALASENSEIVRRIDAVKQQRLMSSDVSANVMAGRAHQFREMRHPKKSSIILPRITSENRLYLPAGLIDGQGVISSQSFAIYDGPIWLLAILCSRLHLAWIATVCGRTRTDFAYSNTLGWNTFPVPPLTERNKADLTRCAEDILLAREAHFPATIAELYEPERMPDDLRAAHDRNDETLERIYIGRRFRNDTERLEKLFDMYTKMTARKETA